jgi:hypothetical protein
MNTFSLDRTKVDAFVAGELDRDGEAALAQQVARVLPWHWTLPNPTEAALSQIIRRVGGEPALLTWLARYGGVPRLTAAVYGLIRLLDQLSDQPAVVAVLQDLRRHRDLPGEVEALLPPDTGPDTLGSLSAEIEALLANQRYDDTIRITRAATDTIRKVISRADQTDLGNLDDQLDQIQQTIDRVDDAA